MIRLHGHPGSINVRKVLCLAAELDLEVELVERGTAGAPVDDPAYLSLNPFGLVPCLEADGLALAESNTILRYLVRREGRGDLLPADAAGASAVETWLDWQATDLNDSWRYAFMAAFRDKPGFDDPRLIAASRQAFDAKLAIVEAQLGRGRCFVAGDVFTLADIVIGLSVRRWMAFDPPLERFPQVSAYYARLCGRASFLPFGGPDSPP